MTRRDAGPSRDDSGRRRVRGTGRDRATVPTCGTTTGSSGGPAALTVPRPIRPPLPEEKLPVRARLCPTMLAYVLTESSAVQAALRLRQDRPFLG